MVPFPDTKAPRTSSISIYGQGRTQALQNTKNSDRLSDSGSLSSIDLDDRPHPLAFAEATFDPALPIKTKSRLSKDLIEVLHDNAALAYFIQFMDARKAQHLVKFWLEAESYRISLETKQRTMSPLSCNANSSSAVPGSNAGGDSAMGKSNEVFQSSHFCPDPKTTADPEIEERSDVDSKSVHNVFNCVPALNSCRETIKLENSCDNSSVDSPKKTVQASSSVDSGCEVRSNKLSLCAEEEEDVSEGQLTVTPNAQKRPTLFNTHKSSVQAPNDEDQSSESLKDGLVKLETSTEQDAIAIYSKYIAPGVSSFIGIPDDLVNAIEINLFKKSGDIDPQCFVPAQEFVVTRMDKDYYPHFLRSSFHCKHQIDVLTSGNVFLADVLYNDSALFFFMEFMEQEGVRHLVDFLLMADNFRKHLLSQKSGYDGMQAQTDAMVLYDKYFSLQATIPLGFSDPVRYELEANICQETGPNPDCFLKPVRILTQYLEKTFLLQFLSSQLYFKYISECIIIIQNDGADSVSQSKYTGSDSGSEQSLPISSINTLLAMDSKQPGNPKIIKNEANADINIDTNQFKSDALWQRPLAGKLQMAHVDHLGRVTTEFELLDPDKGKESKISKAMKKLVNWEEDKNQEEMAWKVAEMIVKDICSVTMPASNSPLPSEKIPHSQQSS